MKNQSIPYPLSRPQRLFALCLSACASITALAAPDGNPPSVPTWTLYAAGDIASCDNLPANQSAAAKTAQLIRQRLPANLKGDVPVKVITLGDNSYPKGAAIEFEQCYAPTWGQFLPLTLPSPGNHDYATARGAPYFHYFGERAGPANRGYYRIQLGNWRIFSLNSNLKTKEDNEAQIAWLKQELGTPAGSAHARPCTLAFWHHPVFSSGGHGNSNKMLEIWKLLEQAQADLILSGHDHNYERFAPQLADGEANPKGMREFVVGTGGAPLTPVLLRRPNSEAVYNDGHGVLQLDLHEHGYDWHFLALHPGSFSDKGSATCH